MIIKKQREQSTVPNHIILTILALIAFLPILSLVMNSFKSTAEVGSNPLGVPQVWRVENYAEAWEGGRYGTILKNSVIITSATILATLALAGPAAYALARLKLRGSDLITFYFLVGTSVPAQLFIVPLFIMWRDLKLLNTHLGLIIIYCGLSAPFATYLLRSYFISLPEEFVEAARIDGASNFQIFIKIIMPLSWPGFLTAGLVVGLRSWNEFLFAVTFLTNPELKPISTGLFAFQTRYSRDWGLTNAGAVIMVLPIVVLFLFLQRRFIEGLTQGGLKA
jgi:raffinose/stachyose/melibiose transport system permease protein